MYSISKWTRCASFFLQRRIVPAMSDLEGITEAEIAEVMAMEKFMAGDLVWAEKPTNTNFLHAKSLLVHEDGSTIPTLSVELCVRVGKFENDCLWDFSLFKFKDGKQLRLYQVTVVPADKASHNTPAGAWYGPHQHFGELRMEKFGADIPKPCGSHEAWFKEFCKRANIQFGGKYNIPPTQGELNL